MKTVVIAEIGINHNGDINIAKKLIKRASEIGCSFVKFQKRTLDIVYTEKELDAPRQSPFGNTNRDLKQYLEFGEHEYDKIDRFCKEIGMKWFASAWDIPSQKFLRKYDLPCNKVASPMLTNLPLLEEIAKEGRYTFISTGMSTMEEIEKAVSIFNKRNCPFELMHCNSAYPSKNEDANLAIMATLREKFSCDVGYSSHEVGRIAAQAAVALGATSIEKHITLDRAMFGSDQAASIEIEDMERLIKDIIGIESTLGSPIKKLFDYEIACRNKLRRI